MFITDTLLKDVHQSNLYSSKNPNKPLQLPKNELCHFKDITMATSVYGMSGENISLDSILVINRATEQHMSFLYITILYYNYLTYFTNNCTC